MTVLLVDLTSQYGVPSPSYLVGGRPLILDDWAWIAVNVVALVATVFTMTVVGGMSGSYLRRSRRLGRNPIAIAGTPTGILLMFVGVTIIGLSAYGLKSALFDRYFWPIVVPIATLLMYHSQIDWSSLASRWAGLVVTTWLVLAALSVMLMLNSFAFDVARWRGGDRLVELGLAAASIDAGYEWVGQHQPDLPEPGPPSGTKCSTSIGGPIGTSAGWSPVHRSRLQTRPRSPSNPGAYSLLAGLRRICTCTG